MFGNKIPISRCSYVGVNLSAFTHVKRFQGGIVFKAHRLLRDSTLGLRVIKKKKKMLLRRSRSECVHTCEAVPRRAF